MICYEEITPQAKMYVIKFKKCKPHRKWYEIIYCCADKTELTVQV